MASDLDNHVTMTAKAPRAKAPLMGFAAQRFDSALNVCRKFIIYCRGMLLFLGEIAILGGSAAGWAQNLESHIQSWLWESQQIRLGLECCSIRRSPS